MEESVAVEFRVAVSADIERMWEIDQLCFKPGIAFSPDMFFYHLLIEQDTAFVAEIDSEIIGFVLCSIEVDGSGTIVTIDLLDQYRQNGIGEQLMKLAEEMMQQRHVPKIVLQASVDNESAIAFYKKLGYTKTGTISNYYGSDGHALTFEKKL